MNELLDFDTENVPKLQKFIKTTLNTSEKKNTTEIVIKVDGTVGDNYRKNPLGRFQITKDQKNELVVD